MMNIGRVMGKRTQRRATEALFEDRFQREMIKSERLRLMILAGFFLVTAVIFIIVTRSFPQLFPAILFQEWGGIDLCWWLSIIFILMAGYEMAARWIFGYFMNTGRPLPPVSRYMNAFFEVSALSALLYAGTTRYNPAYVLYTPVVFLYFIFIILSALRLNYRLSIFTGSVAAVEYLVIALAVVGLAGSGESDGFLRSMGMNLGKGALLFAGGLATGFVSGQIKRRILDTYRTMEEQNRITGLFGQHVSPAVVERIIDRQAPMESEMRYVCVMFLDIRGFTRFAEGRRPQEVVDYLNYLFDFMIDIVNRNGGFINKFLGDGFMAVFGVPFSEGDDRANAVAAAREIVARVDEEVTRGAIPATRIGIGLHAGEALTGTVGSSLRKEYTIIGDIVNLASRIEQLNKTYGSQLLASGEVAGAVDVAAEGGEDLGEVPVPGREKPVRLFRLDGIVRR